MALGFTSYLIADMTQTVYELAGNKPYPSVADGFYLLFCPLMLAGLLVLMWQSRARFRGSNL